MLSNHSDIKLLNVSEIGKFLYDIRYVILLYVIGDFLTTFHAIESGLGFEENGFLSTMIASYGIWSLLLVKIAILGVIFWAYYSIKLSAGSGTLWTLSKTAISLLGLVLVVNNLLVIGLRFSLFEYMGFL
ncbi:MAG: hypothetical protein AWU59_1523 [Methanolobus sp. T82-4]|jgi:hypothetical protein|nr:MAG: hypothetical protein AWU59_1523 [Methanolobus sp. T82-4]